MDVFFRTFGCKANQYDTERMRQEAEALGAGVAQRPEDAQVCVVNTCTVTNRADADARRFINRLRREHPGVEVVVAGCSSAVKPEIYRAMDGVVGVVEGHDPVEVARAALGGLDPAPLHPRLTRTDLQPLRRREGATRGWLKIQDGCDRKCSFCATRLARGTSRSRPPSDVVTEARFLSDHHPELVLTGIHIGHYGQDLEPPSSLSRLVALLLEEVPGVRIRLGSIEATEVDDLLLDLLADSDQRLAPHLHMPLQSGSDSILRAMRRWHTRDMYRDRTLEIAARLPVLGLGADVITGFPGEGPEDHGLTRALVEELPFTYLHVFPFSPRSGTPAEALPDRPPQRISGDRARDLRELAQEKGRRFRENRVGSEAQVVLEGRGKGLTEDYLRVEVRNPPERPCGILPGRLNGSGGHLYIDLAQGTVPI